MKFEKMRPRSAHPSRRGPTRRSSLQPNLWMEIPANENKRDDQITEEIRRQVDAIYWPDIEAYQYGLTSMARW